MEEQYLGKGEDKMHKIPFEVLVVGLFFSCRKQEKSYVQSIFTLQSIVDTKMTHRTQDV